MTLYLMDRTKIHEKIALYSKMNRESECNMKDSDETNLDRSSRRLCEVCPDLQSFASTVKIMIEKTYYLKFSFRKIVAIGKI